MTSLAGRHEAVRLRDLFEERAGILEFDGGFNREDAEARARAECPAPDAPGSSEGPREVCDWLKTHTNDSKRRTA